MTAENNGREPESTLYKRIGGYDVIAAVIDDLFARMPGDPRLPDLAWAGVLIHSSASGSCLWIRCAHWQEGLVSTLDGT